MAEDRRKKIEAAVWWNVNYLVKPRFSYSFQTYIPEEGLMVDQPVTKSVSWLTRQEIRTVLQSSVRSAVGPITTAMRTDADGNETI